MSELAVGDQLDGRYTIEGVLGVGGFATVYQASDGESGRRVAVKVLDPELLESARAVARFEREIEVVAQLQSPHTVKLFARGTTPDGSPYIVFEHIGGRDLREVLEEEGRLEPGVVRHLMRQVLRSLIEAHRAGVIHRDLKPANIRVFQYAGDPWTVKVLDFGIALPIGDDGPRLTGANELVGTPRYMSPEQLLGEDPGPASDIYGLGIVAWELLVGVTALHGPRWGDQLARLQSGFHLTSDEDDEEFAELAEVIHRMTARRPEDRFNSADAVLRALNEPRARTTEPVRRPPAPATVVEAHQPEDDQARHSLVAGAIIGGLVLTALVGLITLTSTDTEKSAPAVTPPPEVLRIAPVNGSPEPVVAPVPIDLGVVSADASAPVDTGSLNGCGADPDWRGPRTFRQSVVAQEWSSTIYIPKSYKPHQSTALVMVFQSVLMESSWLIESMKLWERAEREGFVVLTFDRHPLPLFGWDAVHIDFVKQSLARALQVTCIEADKLFAVGHGAGTEIVRLLACDLPLSAVALVSDVERPLGRCMSNTATPVIRISGKKDRYVPRAGGANCAKIPVRSRVEIEDEWREHHRCKARKHAWHHGSHGTCWSFDCETAFVACHHDGGHNFANSPPIDELARCGHDVGAQFPITDVVWKFFRQTMGED